MSEISRFYGIVIMMYFDDVGKHKRPHFHARYGEHEAVFAIDPPGLLAGVMPRRQMNMILGWAELHEQELRKNWAGMRKRIPAGKIEGAK